jgi:hypothetical protein
MNMGSSFYGGISSSDSIMFMVMWQVSDEVGRIWDELPQRNFYTPEVTWVDCEKPRIICSDNLCP